MVYGAEEAISCDLSRSKSMRSTISFCKGDNVKIENDFFEMVLVHSDVQYGKSRNIVVLVDIKIHWQQNFGRQLSQ